MAHADCLTSLMWLTAGHLFIGNAIIGVFEGLIMAKTFKTKHTRSILIMILANYISMIAGILGIGFFGVATNNIISINNLAYFICGFFIASYIATIIIEWPFCFWIMRGKEHRRKLSFKASVLLQSISYIVLVPIYLSVSGITLITKTKVDKPGSFVKTKDAWIYFISSNDGSVYKINADGSNKQKVKETGVTNQYATLFVCNKDGKNILNIHWSERKGNYHKDMTELVLENISGETAVSENCGTKNTIRRRWNAIDFRTQDNRDWHIGTSTWAIEGLRGKNKKSGKFIWLTLETPFLMWSITKATILPEDQVVCQVGENQIVLIDLNTSHIGLITFGKGPVVVIEK
jgi:hypothetical protein